MMKKNAENSKPQQTVGKDGDAKQSDRSPRVARSISGEDKASEKKNTPWSFGNRNGGKRPQQRAPRARRMSLSVTRVDAWSVAKVTFLLSVAGGIIQIVAVALIWVLLNVVGVFDQVTQIVSSTGLDAGGFNLASIFSFGTVLSAVTIFAIVGVIIATLFAVILAALYNVVSQLVGGVHVTLGDD
ncbi:hypothetical protein FHX77_001152 [Bifidobacterium commune]|nr:hypothetical protein [Bifidobacterium commune]